MVTSKSLASLNEKDSEAKKKQTPAKHKPPSFSGKNKEYGESLVGSRIRVWWPIDRKFYDGVVDSYSSSQKKHKVLYDDGDEEKLDMKKERWELIEDDVSANEKESANESSDAISKLLKRKKAQANGKSSEKGRTDDAMATKKQKTDSSAKRFKDPICVYSKSKAKSGKKSEDSEGESVKPKGGVNKAEKSREGVAKDDGKQSSKSGNKPETDRNDKMGDIGGKIVAAASRLSGMNHSKENGQKKETETKRTAKSLNSNKKISESNNTKQKKSSSSSEAVSEKVKRSKTVPKEIKSNSNGNTDENNDSSDDESKPLVNFLKKSPEAIDALKEKLKGKKESEAVEESDEE